MSHAVDSHAHTWNTTAGLAGPPADLDAGLERLLSEMEAAGVQRVLLIQPSHRGADHSYLLDAASAHRPRFKVVVLGVPSDNRATAELGRLCDDPAVVGIRLAPLRTSHLDWFGAGADSLWQLARARAIAICVLASPAQLSTLLCTLDRFADVPVVIDHLGRPDLGPAATWLRVVSELASLPNATIKISALSSISAGRFPFRESWDWVKQVVQRVGPDRLLWGSDFPYLGQARSLSEARAAGPLCLAAAGLSPDEVAMVMYRNADAMFWKSDGPSELHP